MDVSKGSTIPGEVQGPGRHSMEAREVPGNLEIEEVQELVFEREVGAVDFEPEVVYSWDTLEKKHAASGKTYTPPPDFQTALKAFPQELYQTFREKLRGEIVGIWPIKSDALQSKK